MNAVAGRRAAEHVSERHDLRITVAGLGEINVGPPDQLAYFAGIATLAFLEIIDWPLAIVIAAGHLMAEQQRSRALRAFGAALEEA